MFRFSHFFVEYCQSLLKFSQNLSKFQKKKNRSKKCRKSQNFGPTEITDIFTEIKIVNPALGTRDKSNKDVSLREKWGAKYLLELHA